MKAKVSQSLSPHPRCLRARRIGPSPMLMAAALLVLGLFLNGSAYGKEPDRAQSDASTGTQASTSIGTSGFRVPIPEIKLRRIIGDRPARKAPPAKEEVEPPSQRELPSPAPRQPTREGRATDSSQRGDQQVDRLPFERIHPFRPDRSTERPVSDSPRTSGPVRRVPLFEPPKAPDDLLEAPPPRKEVIAETAGVTKLPRLLRVEPIKETPKALQVESITPGEPSKASKSITMKKRGELERIVLVPSQPEFDETPSPVKPDEAPKHAQVIRPDQAAKPDESDESRSPAAVSAPPHIPRTVEAQAVPKDAPKVARATPSLEMHPPGRPSDRSGQAGKADEADKAPPSLTFLPPARDKHLAAVPGDQGSVTEARKPAREIPPIAIAPPEPAAEPPKRDQREALTQARPVEPLPGTTDAREFQEPRPKEADTEPTTTRVARARPSEISPLDTRLPRVEKRVTKPKLELPFPSPLDADARDDKLVRDYLRATAPLLEQLSLMVTTAPTLAIANYDPSEPGPPEVLKDVLLKMNAMKRDLQILDSKTFAIIPPRKYLPFHSMIRESIAQTYQACNAIIHFLDGGKDEHLAKIQEHLSKAKELMQKARYQRG